MVISGWFVALLLAGAVPLIVTNDPAWLGYWLLITALLAGVDLIIAGSPRRVQLSREVPTRVRLGETVTATLIVHNTGSRPIRGAVRDAWEPSAGSFPTRTRVSIPAGERRAIRTNLTPVRRGERKAAHVTVRSFGALRLAARQATIAAPSAIRVLPPFHSRKHLPSRLARLRELDGRTSVQIRGQGTEFDSLREYVRGDDVRSIDWRATARRSEPQGGHTLMVRTWRPERDRRVVVVIDSGRTSAARIDGEPRIDTAFESALLLAALATRAGDRVDLLVYDRRVRARVHGASGPDLLSRMVDAMAPVEPELIEPDWGAVPELVRSVTSQRALVVIATTVESPGASRGLLAILPQLTRRHTVVISSVLDPDIVAATLDRSRKDEVYLAAAAERALLDQSRVAAAIRQLGGEVVTGAPSELPRALADTYIALKAAGRL